MLDDNLRPVVFMTNDFRFSKNSYSFGRRARIDFIINIPALDIQIDFKQILGKNSSELSELSHTPKNEPKLVRISPDFEGITWSKRHQQSTFYKTGLFIRTRVPNIES
ncbi:MAG: hypothetical protein Q9M91_01790 [Candidatus Dojkabacteria bacterium]|nr:hypothetical protein [Candidatus Dojkabacteria bacterium]MDQ7020556.1 hypothetical protein [Candidatus Dojkabacteria bacterium]